MTERRAMKAERETADRLIAHFLADRIGATFTGRISGVTRAGLFVKLEDTGADGFVPARTLGAEYFQYDESRQAMIGTRSGAMHRLGDVVEVKLVEAAPVAGALRFELLSNGSRREPTARKSPLKARGRPRNEAERPDRSKPNRKDRRKAKAQRRSGKASKGQKKR
jgi:ribonuclease R